MRYRVDWVDAFTDQPFGGNGCAVVHDGASLDDERCKAFVRETSLVECTFTGPSDVADIHVRYFMATREIPFAGHPTIATAVALRHQGIIGDGVTRFETGAGVIPVQVTGTSVTLTTIAPTFGDYVDAHIVAAAGGLEPADIVHPPRITSTGLPFCITVLRDRATLERVALQPAGLKAYFAAIGQSATDLLEPYWVTQQGFTAEGDTAARLLLAPPLPAEDPFTGSATGATAAYLWAEGLIETPDYVAEQGHGMGRPGQARVRVLGPRDQIAGVEVTGRGYVLMSGSLFL